MRIDISSDGTPQGTTLKIDGRTVTDEEDVMSLNFYGRVGWKSNEEDDDPGRVEFDYSTREYSEEDGGVNRTSYSFSSGKMEVTTGKLGRDVEDREIPDDRLASVSD